MDENVPPTPDEAADSQQQPTKKRNVVSNFQSIEEWERKEVELDAQKPPKPAQNSPKPMHNPPKKVKTVLVLDPNVKAAEELALEEVGNVNWVGRLYEFRMAQTVKAEEGLNYIEASDHDKHFPRFSCRVLISENPQVFEDDVTFTSKKYAKQYIAKKTVDWLIANRLMPADGSARFPKAKQLSVQAAPSTPIAPPARSGSNSPPGIPPTSYPSLIPHLCHKLGISPPKYVFVQEFPPLTDAYADFGGDPTVNGKVGEVNNVFGKKNAKEQCAAIVYKFLKDIERHRQEVFEKLEEPSGKAT